MIITEIFRKGRASNQNCHVAHDFYIPAVTQWEVVMPVITVSHRYENNGVIRVYREKTKTIKI